MADPATCSCGACLELGLRFPRDPVQLTLIGGGPEVDGPAQPLLDAPAAASAGVSEPMPPNRDRKLAAATTGVDR